MIQTLDIFLFIALGLVFVILIAGIYTLFRGGSFSRTWSNKLMRLRVLFQFIAVVILVVGFALKGALSG